MIFYDQLEDDIKLLLDPVISENIELEVMPETEAQFSRPFVNPRITISYKSSEFTPSSRTGTPDNMSTGPAMQTEWAIVTIFVRARLLRGARGIHYVFGRIRSLIYGKKTSNFGKMFFESFELVTREDSVFVYALTVVCESRIVENFDEISGSEPLLQQVELNYQ